MKYTKFKGQELKVKEAVKASQDKSGNDIKDTYGSNIVSGDTADKIQLKNKNDGTLNEITVNDVNHAINADRATYDEEGRNIRNNYSLINETANKVESEVKDNNLNITIKDKDDNELSSTKVNIDDIYNFDVVDETLVISKK